MGHWHRKPGIKTAMSLVPKGFLAEQLEEENNNPLNGHLTRTTGVSVSQLTTPEPVCYFNSTHPPNHSHLSR